MPSDQQKAKRAARDLKNAVKDAAQDAKSEVKDAAHEVNDEVQDAGLSVELDVKRVLYGVKDRLRTATRKGKRGFGQ